MAVPRPLFISDVAAKIRRSQWLYDKAELHKRYAISTAPLRDINLTRHSCTPYS